MFLFSVGAGMAGAWQDPMKKLKTQYFLSYAIMGSLVPFLPVYLKGVQGLQESQIGLILGLGSTSILFTPVLMTFLADTRFDPRRLAATVFAVSGLSLLALHFLSGFWWVLLLLGLHSLAYAAVMPLHDGMTFSIQRRRESEGRASPPYYQIRVWGTVGFILPSLILFGFLRSGWTTSIILLCAFAFSMLSLVNAFRVPDPRLPGHGGPAGRGGVPTLNALRTLLQPHMRLFCAGMFFVYLASFSFGSFYPLYMVEIVGVAPEWVGLIFNYGVAIEIVCLLAFGRLQARFGLRNIMIAGIGCLAAQTLLLGLFPNVWVAFFAQTLHGLIILAVFISPVMYLNRQAEDRYRSSIQGVYTMAILGISRIGGIIAAGQVAQANLRLLPFLAAGLSVIAMTMFVCTFRGVERAPASPGAPEPLRGP